MMVVVGGPATPLPTTTTTMTTTTTAGRLRRRHHRRRRGVPGPQDATYELGHEGNHEVEKTDGLDESETKNGVGEELATESGVAGNGVEEGGEDETDTDTSTGKTDGGGTHTEVLGDLDHGLGDLRGVGALLEGGAGGGVDDGAHLLTLEGLEGRGLGGACGKQGGVRHYYHWASSLLRTVACHDGLRRHASPPLGAVVGLGGGSVGEGGSRGIFLSVVGILVRQFGGGGSILPDMARLAAT